MMKTGMAVMMMVMSLMTCVSKQRVSIVYSLTQITFTRWGWSDGWEWTWL